MMTKDTESRIFFLLKKLAFLLEDKDYGDHLFRQENLKDFLIFQENFKLTFCSLLFLSM